MNRKSLNFAIAVGFIVEMNFFTLGGFIYYYNYIFSIMLLIGGLIVAGIVGNLIGQLAVKEYVRKFLEEIECKSQ